MVAAAWESSIGSSGAVDSSVVATAESCCEACEQTGGQTGAKSGTQTCRGEIGEFVRLVCDLTALVPQADGGENGAVIGGLSGSFTKKDLNQVPIMSIASLS